MLIEVCVDSASGLAAAVAGGAGRIELCAALEVGGLTPSAGLMQLAAGCGVPVFAMIRPRAGDFVYSAAELALMQADIAQARQAGLAGVVLGASTADGRLDGPALHRLVTAAEGMGLTLHRAVDLVPDLTEAVELAVELGFARILSSGQAVRAEDGLAVLARLVELAVGRLSIMPGAGISAANAARFVALGVTELHASCSAPVPVQGAVARLGFAGPGLRQTQVAAVQALCAAVTH
ncbi:copper homeostasis protein CutC [Gemmobacter fulvus]|uniref:copper homeostasis protein CutC n=1 Tax=Gemmobacter fulvus TaxID=2840474 RepID=UPI0027965193|nr:copper homeostasis protein CutC [Gemmobacter fulvus]MDQ1848639.1 copper homeostasis protein CutC [Gemmobacter fulvus]